MHAAWPAPSEYDPIILVKDAYLRATVYRLRKGMEKAIEVRTVLVLFVAFLSLFVCVAVLGGVWTNA